MGSYYHQVQCDFQLRALKRSGPDGFSGELGISLRCLLAAILTNPGNFQCSVRAGNGRKGSQRSQE